MDLLRKLSFIFNRREKLHGAVLLAFMFVGAGLEMLGLGLIMPFIGLIAEPGKIGENKYLEWLFRWSDAGSTQEFLIWCGFGIAVLYFVKNSYLAFLAHFQYRFAFDKMVSLARQLFTTYLYQPYPFYLDRNSAEVFRCMEQVGRVSLGVLMPLLVVITEIMIMVCVLGLLFWVAAIPALAAIVLLGGTTGIFYSVVRKKVKEGGQKSHYFSTQAAKWFNQAFGGIKEAKILGREDFFIKSYLENYEGDARVNQQVQVLGQFPRLVMEVMAVGGVIFMIGFLLRHSQSSASVIPTLALFGLSAIRLMPSITRIVSSITMMRYSKSGVDIVYGDLKALSPAVAKPVATSSQEIRLRSSLELKSISFTYPGARTPAISGVTLSIAKGESVAFVGPSGAGKTTLVDLILGLLEPAAGKVLVDGVDIRRGMQNWQKRIGYIPQAIYLCDDSLRRNIAFGVPDAEIDDRRVWDAIRAARLEEVAHQLGSLDTLVGERGVRLSGGQRQRIGIARALYHDPDLLVLDEATSSLDHETELEVVRAIERLSTDKTVLVIAHRLSTAKNCKRVYRIVDGRVSARGAFHEVVGAT